MAVLLDCACCFPTSFMGGGGFEVLSDVTESDGLLGSPSSTAVAASKFPEVDSKAFVMDAESKPISDNVLYCSGYFVVGVTADDSKFNTITYYDNFPRLK